MERHDTLYGRRKGKPLSPRREGLMATLYPSLALDPDTTPPADPATLFPVPVRAVRMEIGFGGGEHLVHEAAAAPDIGHVGVEPFAAGMGKAVSAIADAGLRNVRLFDGDAVRLLDWLPPAALSRIDLLYPDPWPKRRHWKRRFVGPANLDRIARVLSPGGLFRFASDIDSYVAWTLFHLGRRQDFLWTAERADDWRLPFPGWPGTRYEAKALAAGRKPAYLAFRRL
ncbi:MAG TPA: tRNA (guanosine(46)-N7)-methyltransferase TrmB [Bauldia sp.]|nr:tRNA (guanosine(46)-N7)-methyltransferase TrmB [Bauldia sp.]